MTDANLSALCVVVHLPTGGTCIGMSIGTEPMVRSMPLPKVAYARPNETINPNTLSKATAQKSFEKNVVAFDAGQSKAGNLPVALAFRFRLSLTILASSDRADVRFEQTRPARSVAVPTLARESRWDWCG